MPLLGLAFGPALRDGRAGGAAAGELCAGVVRQNMLVAMRQVCLTAHAQVDEYDPRPRAVHEAAQRCTEGDYRGELGVRKTHREKIDAGPDDYADEDDVKFIMVLERAKLP